MLNLWPLVIHLWCLPDCGNLASVNWGKFNFAFVGAPIDLGTSHDLAKIVEHNYIRILKVSVLQAMPN